MLYNTKRCRLSPTQGTSQDEASFQDPGLAMIDGAGLQLNGASAIEKSVSGVRTEMFWDVWPSD